MANVCILRHQGYIKSKMHFPYQHNFRTLRDILGQVDEKTTLSYIYNSNTEQEILDIMNKALNSSNKKNKKN